MNCLGEKNIILGNGLVFSRLLLLPERVFFHLSFPFSVLFFFGEFGIDFGMVCCSMRGRLHCTNI